MDADADKIKRGLCQYQAIMSRIQEVDVSRDSQFQKSYNGFYRIRQQPKAFYACYYTFMEENKHNSELTFEQVLAYLYEHTGKVHASFGSKLLATIRPEMPLWDKYVLQNLGLRMPSYYRRVNRMDAAVSLYQQICAWYQSGEAEALLPIFNRMFPQENITDVKKVDFLLWQSR